MAYYAIGIKPLMDRLEGTDIGQEWFADEAACLGGLPSVKKWWDQLNDFAPNTEDFCNTEEKANKARIFENTESTSLKLRRNT